MTKHYPQEATLRRSCDVVIVGAGVVGLFTALLLKKQGIDVQIYERQPGLYPLPKAMSLSDEVLRAFHLNGFSDLVREHVINAGVQSNNPYFLWTDANHNILSKFRNQAPGSSGYSAMSAFHQPNFEAYLVLQCETHEIPLYRRWNFTHSHEQQKQQQEGESDSSVGGSLLTVHFERHTSGLSNVYNHQVEVECKWLIGCDGANSTVRQHAGLKQQDLLFQYDWLVVDLLPNKDVPRSITWTQICDRKRPTTVIGEGINGRTRFEFMRLDNETVEDLSKPETTWKLLERYHMNPSNTEIERAAVYRFQALNTLDYWDGSKTLIAGDAAHLSPPFIGQGLNSGFRDAIGLSWRLARILKNQSDARIMHSYSLERRKHTQHLIDIATSHGDLICELNSKRADELHSAMRKRYLAGGEKEEPFLESVLDQNGCLLSDKGGGQIFLNRPILPAATLQDQTPQLYDNVISTTAGWRVFQLLEKDEEVLQNGFDGTLAVLSFLQVSVVSISERQDYEGKYASFLGRDNRVALIRPDQYVFGFFTDLNHLCAHADIIKQRLHSM